MGSFAFYTLSNSVDSLKQYQGKYVCYASNELGTAVSDEATLNTDGEKAPDLESTQNGHSLKFQQVNSQVMDGLTLAF